MFRLTIVGTSSLVLGVSKSTNLNCFKIICFLVVLNLLYNPMSLYIPGFIKLFQLGLLLKLTKSNDKVFTK